LNIEKRLSDDFDDGDVSVKIRRKEKAVHSTDRHNFLGSVFATETRIEETPKTKHVNGRIRWEFFVGRGIKGQPSVERANSI